MRFQTIIIGYFIIGATMWGGGAIDWDDSGVGNAIINSPESGEVNDETRTNLENSGGPIQSAAQSLSGGLVAVWNLVIKLIGYLFWPITVLQGVNAPARVWVLLGGAPTVAFYVTFINLIRGS